MKDNIDILKTAKSLIDKKLPLITNLSNLSALLNNFENINWCGFYLLKDDALYLGPFQGEVACSMIPLFKGVCGKAVMEKKTIIVDDVLNFKGHIACSNMSRSEIVTPIFKDDMIVGVIDIDSPIFCRFNNEDAILLEELSKIISEIF